MKSAPHVRDALGRVADALNQMEKAATLEEFEAAWKAFLHATERVWNKMQAHYKKSPKWLGWAGKAFTARTNDMLLSYLINARGAEEHTVEAIVGREGGGIGINPAEGNSLFIEKMEMSNGVLSITSPQALKITFIPARTKLLPVTNRGRLYPVPTSHLGRPVDPADVLGVAKAGFGFYEQLVGEAETFFTT